MVSKGLHILGIALAVIGWIGVIMMCILPMWKVSASIGQNIITAQAIWQGLWMSCVVQPTGQMQCKVYDSILWLPQDMQVSRALTVISILVGVVGLLLAGAGGKCTNCIEDERAKAKVAIMAGIILIIAGVLCLIPVCWMANTIIRDFNDPKILMTQKKELGASLFIGWAASALLIIGGGLFCASCPLWDQYSTKYTAQPGGARGYTSEEDTVTLQPSREPVSF